jgi:uncharacterized protein YcfJ
MKKLIPILMLGFLPAPALADYYNPGGVEQTRCYDNVYREEYVPGTATSPGYVRRHNQRVEVPCRRNEPRYYPQPIHEDRRGHVDDNSCIEGSVLGGLAGGAIGGAAATQENWIWSIPTGIVGGALLGCQIDGG